MRSFQEPPGRLTEISVGIILSAVSSAFIVLLVLLLIHARLNLAYFVGAFILSFVGFWFGLLAYRLILNRPRGDGGLLSVFGLKLWSLLLGFASLGMFATGVYIEQVSIAFGGVSMLVMCMYGWKVASKRVS